MSASGQERFVNFYTDFAFQRLFEQAEIAQYTPAEVGEYERSLKEYRDIINVVNTAERKGFAEGVYQVAKQLKMMNMSDAQISQATGLSPEEINNL